MDMIENVVQKVMSDAMQPNYFIIRALQNSLIQDLLTSFNCVICQNVAQPALKVFFDANDVLIHGFKAITVAQRAERKMGQVKHLF